MVVLATVYESSVSSASLLGFGGVRPFDFNRYAECVVSVVSICISLVGIFLGPRFSSLDVACPRCLLSILWLGCLFCGSILSTFRSETFVLSLDCSMYFSSSIFIIYI